MEKEKYFKEEKESTENKIPEKESARENVERETKIKSRLSRGWGKIKEKIKQPLEKNAKRAIVLSSIALSILSASEGMAIDKYELSDAFKKDTNKQELVLKKEDTAKLEFKELGAYENGIRR